MCKIVWNINIGSFLLFIVEKGNCNMASIYSMSNPQIVKQTYILVLAWNGSMSWHMCTSIKWHPGCVAFYAFTNVLDTLFTILNLSVAVCWFNHTSIINFLFMKLKQNGSLKNGSQEFWLTYTLKAGCSKTVVCLLEWQVSRIQTSPFDNVFQPCYTN